MKQKLLLILSIGFLLILLLGCAQVPLQNKGQNESSTPSEQSGEKHTPDVEIKNIIQFVNAAKFPKLKDVSSLLDYPENEVAVFQVRFGEPQDCESGCVYSAAWGIKNKEKIGWLSMKNKNPIRDAFDASTLSMYDFDAKDKFLLSKQFRLDLLKKNEWAYHNAFLRALFKDPDTKEVWKEIATELKTMNDPDTASLMVRSGNVQKDREVLKILAELPADVYDDARESARSLFGNVSPFVKLLKKTARS